MNRASERLCPVSGVGPSGPDQHLEQQLSAREDTRMQTTRAAEAIDGRRILATASDFLWRNARLLERHLFAYHFADGSSDPVRAALRAYQNADGGFGQALEPDKRCPDSQPIDVE